MKERNILCQDQVEAASAEAAQEEAEASAEAVAEADLAVAEASAAVTTDIITIIITDPSFTEAGGRDITEAVALAVFWECCFCR